MNKSLHMSGGPYPLISGKIDQVVTKKSAGNYALGHNDEKNAFIVEYVGRSDTDINERLRDWTSGNYKRFQYSYAASPKQAFEKECNNYHDFGENKELDNENHPDSPDGLNLQCPVCGS